MKHLKRALSILIAVLALLPFAAAAADILTSPSVLEVRTDGAIVTFRADQWVTAYCVTTTDVIPEAEHPDWRPCDGFGFSFFKTDGTYCLRVRNKNGMVSEAAPFVVESGFRYVTEAEGLGHLTEPMEDFLAKNGDTIDAFNARIAKSATDAGIYTRMSVGNIGMTLLSDLAGYSMTLSYQPKGNYTLQEEWGVSPGWGTRLRTMEKDSAGTYRHYGMNCGTIIEWVYKQAGLHIGRTSARKKIFESGYHHRLDDNKLPLDAGDTGDIIATKTGHTMMILDRKDTDGDGLTDSYYVLEMESPYLKLKLRSLYSVRLCTLYDMSAVFDNTGALKRNLTWWTGSYWIPKEDFPSYYDADALVPPVSADGFAPFRIQLKMNCLLGRIF
jgi:hypothetical protein